MEDGKRKTLLMCIGAACLLIAVVITYATYSKSDDLDSIKSGQMIWVKCKNPDCSAEYQVDKKEHFRELRALQRDPMDTVLSVCEKCGMASILRAEECEKCGVVFFLGSVPNDFTDRCPECGYSKTEVLRKKSSGGK